MPKFQSKKKDKYDLVTPEFQEFVNGASDEDLKKRLVEVDGQEEQVLKVKKDDTELEDVRAKLKSINEPYSVAIKECKQKRSLIISALKERGQVV